MTRSAIITAALVCAALCTCTGVAAAAPEIGRCVAQPGSGIYRDANCTAKARSAPEKAFEWERGTGAGGRGFAGAGGAARLEGERGTLACTGARETGEYHEVNGIVKEVTNVVITFRECQVPLADVGCQNAAAGEPHAFATNPLKGKIGYIARKTHVVGMELTPMAGRKGKFAVCAFECCGQTLEIAEGPGKGGDRIIAVLPETDVMSTTFTQRFVAKAPGVQEPQSFEGLFHLHNLEWNSSGSFEPMSLSLDTTLTTEQPLELKA